MQILGETEVSHYCNTKLYYICINTGPDDSPEDNQLLETVVCDHCLCWTSESSDSV